MNKIIRVQKREQLVLKVILSLLTIFYFTNYSTHDDKAVVIYVGEQLHTITTDTLYLNVNASNKGAIDPYLDQDITTGDLVQQEKNRKWLAGKTDLEINKEIAILEKVFTPENQAYFKTQIGDYKWDKQVNTNRLRVQEDKRKSNICICKPVYTKDNKYAVVGYSYKGIYSLYILENNNGKWTGIKYIGLWMS